MINVILAIDANNGLGNNGKLPWKIKEELKLFKDVTYNSTLICGRKTFESLPNLKDRKIYVVSKNNDCASKLFSSIEDAIEQAEHTEEKFFIIGGNQIYNYVFNKYKERIIVHISFLKENYKCDTYFDINNLKDFYITSKKEYDEFIHCEMKYVKYGEYQYINLIKDILKNGDERIGRNGKVISSFCKHLKFDLRDGFPLLTTKKMFLKGIIEELLFFIRGDTNSKILEEKGINIWKGNTSREFLDINGFENRKEGSLIPLYGYQWRFFNAKYNEKLGISIEPGIDQLLEVINEIKTNPTSRRILLTSYNPEQVKEGVLYPCHSVIVQFYVQDNFLDIFCYNRSSDAFLGLPWNIASSSLFLMIIAKLTNLTPRYFNLTLGDVHIYSVHEKSSLEQIKRIPYTFSKIILPDIKDLKNIEKLTHNDFKIVNYNYYETIKAEMIP